MWEGNVERPVTISLGLIFWSNWNGSTQYMAVFVIHRQASTISIFWNTKIGENGRIENLSLDKVRRNTDKLELQEKRSALCRMFYCKNVARYLQRLKRSFTYLDCTLKFGKMELRQRSTDCLRLGNSKRCLKEKLYSNSWLVLSICALEEGSKMEETKFRCSTELVLSLKTGNSCEGRYSKQLLEMDHWLEKIEKLSVRTFNEHWSSGL